MSKMLTAMTAALLVVGFATGLSAHPAPAGKVDSAKTFFEEQAKNGS
ncbi:MAG: hypothetical protein NW215_14575 [Hyphomicrobiales bacterium]|nr:hypothetical protein [Hyphomicrobiales bacterium]